MCVLVSSCMCACVWVLAYVRKVRTYIGASWAHNYKEAARTKTCGSEGTCLRVGSRWCAAQAACRQSPGWQWPVQLDSGPIYESWCVCVSVCVGVCGKQLLMPFYNSLSCFLFSFLCFPFYFHFTSHTISQLFSSWTFVTLFFTTRPDSAAATCYMLHATTETSNCRVFSVCSPRLGQAAQLDFTLLKELMLPAYLHYFIYHLYSSECTKKNGGKQKPYGASSYRLCLTSWTKNLTNASRWRLCITLYTLHTTTTHARTQARPQSQSHSQSQAQAQPANQTVLRVGLNTKAQALCSSSTLTVVLFSSLTWVQMQLRHDARQRCHCKMAYICQQRSLSSSTARTGDGGHGAFHPPFIACPAEFDLRIKL